MLLGRQSRFCYWLIEAKVSCCSRAVVWKVNFKLGLELGSYLYNICGNIIRPLTGLMTVFTQIICCYTAHACRWTPLSSASVNRYSVQWCIMHTIIAIGDFFRLPSSNLWTKTLPLNLEEEVSTFMLLSRIVSPITFEEWRFDFQTTVTSPTFKAHASNQFRPQKGIERWSICVQ